MANENRHWVQIFLFNDTATTEIYTLSLHDALPILIVEHGEQTDSRRAQRLLENWDVEQDRFWQICPKEMIDHLEHPLSDVALAATQLAGTGD